MFQEASIVLYRAAVDGKLDSLTSSLYTYFIGICNNKAHEQRRANSKVQLVLWEDYSEEVAGKKYNTILAKAERLLSLIDNDEKKANERNTISSFNCPKCHNSIQELSLTIDEWEILKQVSTDSNFILAMDKLKQDDVIEFNLKLTQFKSQPQQQESAPQPTPNIPKCPTCGSTNVKKISGTKRWVGTGLFGIASSDLEKVMQCKSCGAKW